MESFSVDSLEARNATSNEDVSVLISFGAYTKVGGITSAFAFIYDYMNCKTSAVMEFSGINQGIQECYYNEFFVYLYGTNLDASSILSEQIVHLMLIKNPITKLYEL